MIGRIQSETVEFEQLLDCILLCKQNPIDEERVKKAFGLFDSGDNQISVQQLRVLLTSRGDAMPADLVRWWCADTRCAIFDMWDAVMA